MGRIADLLRDTGATTIDVDKRTGSYEDRSQYRNVVTATGTPTWSASPFGWGLQFTGTQRLTIADYFGGEDDGWILCLCSAFGPVGGNYWAKGSEFRALVASATQISYGDSTLSTIAIASRPQPFLLGVEKKASGASRLFVNGAFLTGATENPAWSTTEWTIGNDSAGGTPFKFPIYRFMNLRGIADNTLVELATEILSERIPTKVYSTQAYVPSGTTRQVVDDYDFSFAPVTLANVTTVNSEIPGIQGLRLMSGSVSVKAQPKALGCTSSALLAGYDTRSRSKRFSFVWTDGTIDVGWTSVRGAPTATGQNAYWVQVSSAGVLRIAKSVSASESVVATGPTLTAGLEYDAHVSWDSATGAIKLWYRRNGASDWTLACEATDTDVTSCSFTVLSLGSSNNKFTRRYTSINEASTPWTWG